MAEPKRNIYLETIPVDAAVARAKAALDRGGVAGVQTIPSQDAAGRVLAAPVFARQSSPASHCAAMDGVAVQASATYAAREGQPVVLVKGQDWWPVNTGHPLPPHLPQLDAVIMIEQVQSLDDERIAIEAAAYPWQHVRRIGEDIVATELLFPRGKLLTPYDVGALLSAGIWDVDVVGRVHMQVIPTGDEILDFTTRPTPGPGQVVESNSMVLAALGRQAGCTVERRPPVADDPAALEAAVREALAAGAQVVVVCAGSSAGSKDFTRHVFERVGELLVHGIAAMPGKPTLLAAAAQGRALLMGAPGYPVSSVVAFEEVLAPVLAWLHHEPESVRPRIEAVLTRKSPSRLGIEEFLRCSVGTVRGRHVASPLGRGAGNITTLCRAQGVVRIPRDVEGLEQGGRVEVELLVPRSVLDQTVVAVGSHDNTLDLLADALMAKDPAFALASSHVGSMGGITALAAGACHMAGAHLFDPATNDFNFPFLAKHLPHVALRVVNLAIRHQGLMVAPGNPLGIAGVADLARPDVRFVNRQRGAGTRILLDHHLITAGVDPRAVNGYGKEEHTHMAVAANVASGAADCGLGIQAAAKALGLEFVPLALERYDLLIPEDLLETPHVQAVLACLDDAAFQARIQALGGYETTLCGRTMQPGQGLGEG
ncbi:molybdopterin biosynthesis protein [Megalodesulfovibrio gigas]|uniref:Molybdopterin molybdenumtransferase n=1 Tax=Megalodesulfovibrio gigas (strain ATCC 19364 / DSM 1382 / NCIMB 9332 / VKM B-1759) TaxID=1121448 RepID=T2G8W5_MEGG1|nr:molybdopterin biosynthesis protein [Megalodesulfovibrio gigas]AGW12551.1 putative molybdopterin biosynthesis protein MoeA/LysR substrate binding-domain-containing protein [Megalodesulfovibrio gigas DSM 1382 = ATCC 19364]